jgi:hypothetical protein
MAASIRWRGSVSRARRVLIAESLIHEIDVIGRCSAKSRS